MLYLLVLSDTLNMEQRIPGKEGTNRGLKGVRSLMQLANDADASTAAQSGKLKGVRSLMQLANDADASTAAQSGKLKGVRSLMQLANGADASTSLLSLPTMLCIYLRSGKLQGSTAAQSGKLKGVIGS